MPAVPGVRTIPRCEALVIVDRHGVVKAVIDTHLDLGFAINELIGNRSCRPLRSTGCSPT